jgi:hypothetical protein
MAEPRKGPQLPNSWTEHARSTIVSQAEAMAEPDNNNRILPGKVKKVQKRRTGSSFEKSL